MEARTGNVRKGEVGMDGKLKSTWMSSKTTVMFGEQMHAPNLETVPALLIRSKMKGGADNTTNVIVTNIGGMYEEVLAKLPRIETIQ